MKAGKICEMAGWGEVEEKVRPTFLKEAKVSIWDQGRCMDRYFIHKYEDRPFTKILCAGLPISVGLVRQ